MLVFLQAFETARILVYKKMPFRPTCIKFNRSLQKSSKTDGMNFGNNNAFSFIYQSLKYNTKWSMLAEKIRNVYLLVKTGAFTLDM